MQGDVAWHRLFTQRLSSDVLLVGPTVSCEGTPNRLNMSELRQNPHVQSFVLATNRVRSQPSLVCSRTRVPICKRCSFGCAGRLQDAASGRQRAQVLERAA